MKILFPIVLQAMTALAPNRDHTVIAGSISRTVADEAPLFADDIDRVHTALVLVAVSFRESTFNNDAVSKTGDYCHLQINRRPDLGKDVDACTRVGLSMLRTSFRVCPKSPIAWYAVGGPRERACSSPFGLRISADRMSLAGWLFRLAVKASESSS